MCKVLFPELQKEAYDKSFEYYGNKEDAEGFYITGINNIGCSYPIYERDDSFHHHLFEQIHWFEFCMTHLIDKLAWENTTSDILADCQYEDNRLKYLLKLAEDRPNPGQYHPIDYLYEEFKKLK